MSGNDFFFSNHSSFSIKNEGYEVGILPSLCHHYVTSPQLCLKWDVFGRNFSPGSSKEFGPSVPLGKLECFSRIPPQIFVGLAV